METKTYPTSPLHERVYQELAAVFRKYGDKLTPPEQLAVAANLVGKLIALQDKNTMTAAMATQIVSDNIERGNASAVEMYGLGRKP